MVRCLWFVVVSGFLVLAVCTDLMALTPLDHEARASVRINNGGCSGVIIAAGAEKAYGVSAAHCAAMEKQEFKVHFADGRSANARWLRIDRSVDLAMFTLWSRDILGVSPVRNGLPDGQFDARAIGYPSGEGPNIKDISLRSASSAQGIPRNAFTIRSGKGWGGDSGGGVFVDGKLIGVVSHMSTAAMYDRNGPNGGASTLYCSQNQQLVSFVRSSESLMEASCRDNWCWTPRPNRDIDTRPLPLPDLDSDRDRQQALQAVLDRLDGIDKQISELNDQQVDANSAIAELQNRLDAIEQKVTKNANNIAAVSQKANTNSDALDKITMVLDKLADADEGLSKRLDAHDASLIELYARIDELANKPIVVEILDENKEVLETETYKNWKIRLQARKGTVSAK